MGNYFLPVTIISNRFAFMYLRVQLQGTKLLGNYRIPRICGIKAGVHVFAVIHYFYESKASVVVHRAG